MYRLGIASFILLFTAAPCPLFSQSIVFGGGGAAGFAAAVAVGGDEIFIGKSGINSVYPGRGAVYVYRRDSSGEWSQVSTISPEFAESGTGFGSSIAVMGNTMVVGAPALDDSSGMGYVFVRSSPTADWVLEGTLTAPGRVAGDAMGVAVAMDGVDVFVGAPSSAGGAVHVFRRASGGAWSHVARLSGNGAGDGFGTALAASGGRLIIGAPGSAGGGAAHVYARDGSGVWTEGSRLDLGSTDLERFGSAVAMTGDVLAVGAPQTDDASGVALVYSREPDSWRLQSKVVPPPDESVAATFGSALSFAGDELIVGAPGADRTYGVAYTFQLRQDTWESTGTLRGGGFRNKSRFGSPLAASSDIAVVGAAAADMRMGGATIFERQGATWNPVTSKREPVPVLAGGGAMVECADGSAGPFDCGEVDLLSFTPLDALGGEPGVMANDIWGWTDPETRKEYALVGLSNGTSFVDVSDPLNPAFLGHLPLTEGAVENLWRDIKVYGDHAFIVADGAEAHGVQVFDLTQLRDVPSPPAAFSETAHYDGVFSAHNIVINEETGTAFVVGSSGGGETCGGGLHMIDIRNPTDPQFAGCFSHSGTGRSGTGYSHDAQCVVYRGPDEQYHGREICFGANEVAVSIADVTDRNSPVALGVAEYPNVGYTHQGWLTEDHRYFFLGDEADEVQGSVPTSRTLVWDVAELEDPVLLTEYLGSRASIDHNQYVRGDILYQSNLMSGLRVLDISDVENPVEVGFFDTALGDDEMGFGGSWSNYPFFESGTVLVNSWREGLFLVRRKATLVP